MQYKNKTIQKASFSSFFAKLFSIFFLYKQLATNKMGKNSKRKVKQN